MFPNPPSILITNCAVGIMVYLPDWYSHLSTGQEAVAVGIEHAITKEDNVITAYRCHGFTYMRGATIKQVIAELLGRRDGIAFGKGSSPVSEY